MKFSRKSLLIVVVAILAAISFLAVPFTSAAATTYPAINDVLANTMVGDTVNGFTQGQIRDVTATLTNQYWQSTRVFRPNSRGEFSIFPDPDDAAYGYNIDYSVDIRFQYPLELYREAELRSFKSFNINVYFYVRQEYNFNKNTSIQNAYFFQPYAYAATFNGAPVTMYLDDYYVYHALTDDPYYANGYYVEAHWNVDVSTIDLDAFTTTPGTINSSSATFEFWLTAMDLFNVYPDQQIMTISTITTSCEYSYNFLPWSQVPMAPEVIQRFEALGMAGTLVSNSANGLGDIVGILGLYEPIFPDRRPSFDSVEESSSTTELFSKLFDLLMVSEITHTVITLGLLFSLVNFVLRR